MAMTPAFWTVAALVVLVMGCAHAAPPQPEPPVTPMPSLCTLTVTADDGDGLRSALRDAAAGVTICVPAGTYRGSFPLRASLTLRGIGPTPGDVVLVSDGRKSILTVGEAEIVVNVEHLTLKGGSFQAGGALHMAVRSRVSLRDCVLTENSATSYGGGAIFASRGELLLDRCVIENNGGGTGGALLADGVSDWTIRESRLRGNRGSWGAALTLRDGANVRIEDSSFDGNVGEQAGGAAILLQGTTTRGPTLSLTRCTLDAGPGAVVNEEGRGTVTVQ